MKSSRSLLMILEKHMTLKAKQGPRVPQMSPKIQRHLTYWLEEIRKRIFISICQWVIDRNTVEIHVPGHRVDSGLDAVPHVPGTRPDKSKIGCSR